MDSHSDRGRITSLSPSSPISPSTTASDAGGSAHEPTETYKYAYSDFYPSKACCVYKSGPIWEVRKGPEEQGIVRQPRPVCRPDVEPVWAATLSRIINCLDNRDVKFTTINAFGWANEGEEKPLCAFVVSIGVIPKSLIYNLAVSTAAAVKMILASINLPEVEVAFLEMISQRQVFLSVDPISDDSKYRKPFSALLGVPIAPLNNPSYEGTGALYIKLYQDTDDVALLTCAHVICPPELFLDNQSADLSEIEPREHMVALGSGSYDRVINEIAKRITHLTREIGRYESILEKPTLAAPKRIRLTASVALLTETKDSLIALDDELTTSSSTPELRTFGHAIYVSAIKLGEKAENESLGWTEDWGLIQVDPTMINAETFAGNKLYFGASFFHSPLLFSFLYCPYLHLPFCHADCLLTILPQQGTSSPPRPSPAACTRALPTPRYTMTAFCRHKTLSRTRRLLTRQIRFMMTSTIHA